MKRNKLQNLIFNYINILKNKQIFLKKSKKSEKTKMTKSDKKKRTVQ
jgi:hypothetical protein